MPRTPELTWQPGSSRRGGRWRKKCRGRAYYFEAGRGKTDRDAHDKAIAAWEKRKAEIDETSPKPHEEDNEREIVT